MRWTGEINAMLALALFGLGLMVTIALNRPLTGWEIVLFIAMAVVEGMIIYSAFRKGLSS